MSSVLYDVPGPRAIARNRILAIVTIAVVLAVVGFVILRMFETGQFSAEKWYVFTFSNVWMGILKALGNTWPPSRWPPCSASSSDSCSRSVGSRSTPGCASR